MNILDESLIRQLPNHDLVELSVCDAALEEGREGVYITGIRGASGDWEDIADVSARVRHCLVGYRHGNYLLRGFDSFTELRRLCEKPSFVMWGAVVPGTLKQSQGDGWTMVAAIPKRKRTAAKQPSSK